VFSKCNHFLLLFGLFLINFNFWQWSKNSTFYWLDYNFFI
jgi:hypothetical protein